MGGWGTGGFQVRRARAAVAAEPFVAAAIWPSTSSPIEVQRLS